VCVALGGQHAVRMLQIVVCGLPHNLINGTIIQKVITPKTSVMIFSVNVSERFLILRRFERNVTINLYWSLCEVSANLMRNL
jgi:hypothetical protein